MIAHEQSLGATLASVHAHIFDPPEVTGEGPLVAHAMGHVELEGRKSILENILTTFNVLTAPSFEGGK